MALSQSALTTLARVKEALGVTSSSEDVKLEVMIETASQSVVTYCGRSFHRTDSISDKLRGYSSMFLQVKRAPLLTINSITYDGTTLDSSGYEIDDANQGMIYSLSGWTNTQAYASAIAPVPLPGTERQLYTVDYDGGYVTPNQVNLASFTTRTLPYDIEQATVDMAVDVYRRLGRDSSIESEKLFSAAIKYRGDTGTMGAKSLDTLSQYRWQVVA